MALPPLHKGALPPGRWVCQPSEIEAAFVTGLAPERQQIWDDWVQLVDVLRNVVGRVPAAWLSGSFFTGKPVPGDIDSVFVVDADDVAAARRASISNAQVLWVIATNSTKGIFKLNVDSFLLEWCPMPGPDRNAPAAYYADRGYWDDLWVRERDTDARLESIPRRGYVEVMIDGYA